MRNPRHAMLLIQLLFEKMWIDLNFTLSLIPRARTSVFRVLYALSVQSNNMSIFGFARLAINWENNNVVSLNLC